MPRTARVVLPDHPHHVVHRGHNRNPVFLSVKDHLAYLSNLAELKEAHTCQVFAYCLMGNHVHLVIDPGSNGENLGELMQRLAIRHTMRVNKIHNRSGTLWEGRYKSSPIQSERYLLACCRYVELNPVRAGMAHSPARYRWSSYRARAGFASADWLDEDLCYRKLGKNTLERQRNYRRLFKTTLSEEEGRVIRSSIRRGRVTKDYPDISIVSEPTAGYWGLSLL